MRLVQQRFALCASVRNRATISGRLLVRGIVLLCAVAVPAAMLRSEVRQNGNDAANAEQGKTRVLRFPEDRAVGIVYTRPPNAERDGDFYRLYFYNRYEDWERLGLAKRNVQVPAEAQVRLDVSADASVDLSFLKELRPDDLHWLNLRSTKVIDTKLIHIKHLTGLRFLDLAGTPVSESGIENLETLVNLQAIDVARLSSAKNSFRRSDEVLSVLSKLPKLSYISIGGHNVTDAGLLHLRGKKSLRYLRLGGNRITDQGLAALKGLTNLEHLDMASNQISDMGLMAIENFPQLVHLNIARTNITNAGLAHLAPLKSLKSLRMYGIPLTDEGTKHLAKLKSLENIFANLQVTGEGVRNLSQLPRLQFLSLSGMKRSDLGIDHIAKMNSLKSLWFQACKVTDGDLEKLSELKRLEQLLLHDTQVTDDGLRHLAKFPALENLSIYFSKDTLSNSRQLPALRHLEHLDQLKQISVGGEGMEINDLPEIGLLTGLEYLHISRIPLDDAGIGFLSGLTSLRILLLAGPTNVTDEGIKALADMENLEFLMISARITDKGLKHLKKLKSLRRLSIASPHVTDEGIADLKRSLPSLQKVSRYEWRP